MKLLFIIYGSLDQISGGYLYDRQVVGYLRRQGVQIEILSLQKYPYPIAFIQALQPRLRKVFRSSGVDYHCLVIDELTHPSLFPATSLKRPGGPPVMVLVHHLRCSEPGPLRLLARGLEGILLRAANALVVNSSTTARAVRGLLGRDRRQLPLYICRPGADTLDPGAPAAASSGPRTGVHHPIRLLVIGNVIPRKGHDTLIRILARLKAPEWDLRLVGGQPDRRYKRKLDRLIRDLDLERHVRFTGELAEGDLRREYRQADIFLFPTRYEGFGIALAEAIRAGLPFVAFASGAIREVVGEVELLAAPGDSVAFGNLLRRLMTDPEFYRRSGEDSLSLAGKLPTWEETGRRFFKAVKQVVGHA